MLVHEFVTGGGLAGQTIPPSWRSEGQAMRRALAEDFASLDGVDVVMTLDLSLPDEPASWRVVRVGPGEEPATFARLAEECDLTLCVAPETGGVLEARALKIARSLGSSPEAIRLCGHKIRLGEHLHRLGVPTPDTLRVVPAQGLPEAFPYPSVLKPIDGAGSLDTWFLEDSRSLPAAALALPEAILQPFVDGDPMSASFLIPHEGGEPIWLGLGRQHMVRKGGMFGYEGGDLPVEIGAWADDLRALLVRVIETIPGLAGWVGIDLIREHSTGNAVVLEINPRVTTSYIGWRAMAGPPGALAAMWMGQGPRTFSPTGRPVRFAADGSVEEAR